MLPLDIIIEFERHGVSTFSFDWECVLENGYRQFLTQESCVIDVGGHVGRHSNVFVNDIGCKQVVIFEPLPAQRRILEQRFRKHNSVRILPFALSSDSGSAEFVVNSAAPEESGLRERIYNDPQGKKLERLRVPVRRLDELDLGLERLDYIKIDAEGAEIDIVKGASKTLARFRPVLSVEYGLSSYTAYGHSRTTLFEIMDSLGYTLCDVFGNPFDAEQWDNVVDRFYWDFYAVANEKVDEFHSRVWDLVYRQLDDCRFAK